MSDEKDCCCDEGSPTPERKGAGKALPPSDGGGTPVTVLAGGTRNADGSLTATPFTASPSGAFVFEELPHGVDGTYVNDNLTEVLVNGRIISRVISGSGGWSKTA